MTSFNSYWGGHKTFNSLTNYNTNVFFYYHFFYNKLEFTNRLLKSAQFFYFLQITPETTNFSLRIVSFHKCLCVVSLCQKAITAEAKELVISIRNEQTLERLGIFGEGHR